MPPGLDKQFSTGSNNRPTSNKPTGSKVQGGKPVNVRQTTQEEFSQEDDPMMSNENYQLVLENRTLNE
jgi:hypothetical protein